MYSQNIKKNYVFSFFMNFNVTSAIWMIYLASIGFNQFHIGLFMSIASIFSALCAAYTHKIEKIISEKLLLKYIPLIMSLTVWGIALSKVA
ncbi:hypothetical protein OSSY52_16640 [Tepiditoga spiralis]|uniref:Uncharacterized protein n=1 Tax=Tepiditoga spiralis TaxID=2108365 RepID=A0A7G1G994_9BACT|nr:hypothetical protein [Tepiditoga spiralis]BBE31523.1 hypothetical protein OSSY52_16640 [Tepiditoga spiralis]